jgi:hypothetical protein
MTRRKQKSTRVRRTGEPLVAASRLAAVSQGDEGVLAQNVICA